MERGGEEYEPVFFEWVVSGQGPVESARGFVPVKDRQRLSTRCVLTNGVLHSPCCAERQDVVKLEA